ncbi:MAG: hypothetical protein J5800_02785, partial [Spirochaetales bacterium]|nr:hypothetical protein [Spirochaetales bacterium]
FRNQFEAFKRGEAKFTFQARLMGDDESVSKTIDSLTYFINEVGNNDLLAVTLCSESRLG